MKKPKKENPKPVTYTMQFNFITVTEPEWYTLGYSSQKDMDENYIAVGKK